MQLDVKAAITSSTNASLAFPKIVGSYSLDNERNYQPNFSKLRYLTLPNPHDVFDLNRGFRHFVSKSHDVARVEQIRHLLEFIANNLPRLRQLDDAKILRYDFVCFRGLLSKIMITPFELENWTIRAACLKGTIYLWSWEEERVYPNMDQFVHWGYKFENYMFSKDPNIKPNGDEPANANEEFCVMFSTRINGTLVLYGAEVDGVESDVAIDERNKLLDGVKLVEVKTNRIIFNQRGEKTFIRKTLKWFCQSFLVGIENIYVGFRDQNGIVKEVVKYPVNDLPKKATGMWDKKTCLKFLDSFLKFVQIVVGDNSDPYTTWLFDYNYRDNIVRVRKKENNLDFLPLWYIELINKVPKV